MIDHNHHNFQTLIGSNTVVGRIDVVSKYIEVAFDLVSFTGTVHSRIESHPIHPKFETTVVGTGSNRQTLISNLTSGYVIL